MDLKDKKTKIKFYEGMRTIGGTVIEVIYEDYSIIFDFGAIFDPNIDESKLNDLESILDNNLAPRLKGVYDKNITNENIETYKNKAVFISHIHLDHTKMINYIDESISVYMTNDTKNLLEALNINEDFIYKNKFLSNSTRKIIGLDYDEIVEVGKIKVQLIRVDHNGYGAVGFIINTPDMKIAYTGDLRLHGFRKEDSLRFANLNKSVDLLIMEAVSLSWDEGEDDDLGEKINEFEHIQKFDDILKQNPNSNILFNYYDTDIERLMHLYETSKKNNRIFVLSQFNAYVFKKVTNIDVNYYRNNDYDYDLNKNLEIKIDELISNKSKYIWQLKKENIDLIKKIDKDSIYLHMDANPFGEFDPDFKPFINEFKQNDIKLILLKVSGHAYPRDLFKIIDTIQPKILVPIHSLRPEMLYNSYGERFLPEKNQII